VQSLAKVSRVNPACGETNFSHESSGKDLRGGTGLIVLVLLGALAISISFVDDAELTKKGIAKSIPITIEVAIVTYERDLLGWDEGAAGESFIIVGFSLRTDLKLSRKRDWCVTTRKLTWI